MKRLFNVFPLLLLLLLSSSCTDMLKGQSIKGDGNVVNEIREVSPFHKITIEGIFNVYLRQGEEEKVRVEADKNLQPYIIVKSREGELLLSWKEDTKISKFKKNSKIRIYVTLRDIDALVIDGVGKVETENPITAEEFNLSITGVGKTDLHLQVDKLVSDISAVGKVELQGVAENASMEISGVGLVDAENLTCKRLVLENSGVGKVKVHATQFLHIDSEGIGAVYYKGNPEIKEISADGIGKVDAM